MEKELTKILEERKMEHELPNDNTIEYNLGYIKCVNDTINIIKFYCTNKGCLEWKNNNKCGHSTTNCHQRTI